MFHYRSFFSCVSSVLLVVFVLGLGCPNLLAQTPVDAYMDSVIDIQPNPPYRDNPGDVIDDFQLPYTQNSGLAWDGERIWGVCRTGERHLFSINPDNYEVEDNFVIDQSDAIGMTYDWISGLFWVCEYVRPEDQSIAHLYDSNGDQIDEVLLPRGGHHGLAFDGTYIYANSENDQRDQRIYRLERDGEIVAEGPDIRGAVNHGRAISLAWAGAHDEGQFWLMSVGYISQLAIDFENNEVEVIQEFRSNNTDYPHQGLVHDGFKLWAGGTWARDVVIFMMMASKSDMVSWS